MPIYYNNFNTWVESNASIIYKNRLIYLISYGDNADSYIQYSDNGVNWKVTPFPDIALYGSGEGFFKYKSILYAYGTEYYSGKIDLFRSFDGVNYSLVKRFSELSNRIGSFWYPTNEYIIIGCINSTNGVLSIYTSHNLNDLTLVQTNNQFADVYSANTDARSCGVYCTKIIKWKNTYYLYAVINGKPPYYTQYIYVMTSENLLDWSYQKLVWEGYTESAQGYYVNFNCAPYVVGSHMLFHYSRYPSTYYDEGHQFNPHDMETFYGVSHDGINFKTYFLSYFELEENISWHVSSGYCQPIFYNGYYLIDFHGHSQDWSLQRSATGWTRDGITF